MTPLNVPTKVVIPKDVLIKVKNSLDMKQNQFEFKPFDQVLVRDGNSHNWSATLFSRTMMRDGVKRFISISLCSYEQCIPYNEQTAYLNGKCLPYEEPQPKVWQIASTGYNDTMTSEELSNFIQVAVINNKDITDFRIRYIGNN